MDPTDYWSHLIPTDPIGSFFAGRRLANEDQRRQIDLATAQRSSQQAQADAARLASARLAFETNPTAANRAALIMADPAHTEALKAGFDALEADTQKSELQYHSMLGGLLETGDPARAIQHVQQRRDAEEAAGHPTDAEDDFLELLRSGKDGLEAAKRLNDYTLAAAYPNRFSETYAGLEGERRAAALAPGQLAKQGADLEAARAEAASRAAEADRARYLVVSGADGAQHVLRIGADQVAPSDQPAPTGAAPAAPAPGQSVAGPSTAAPTTPQTAPASAPVIPGRSGREATEAARNAGASPDDLAYLAATATLESAGNPDAKNGRSTGLFQFHPDTFAAAGGRDISNAGAQAIAALNLAKQNAEILTPGLGREPSPSELYLAHQQGATGAMALLAAPPETNAIAALQGAGVAPRIARLSILNNGGTANMTAGQFVQKWQRSFDNVAQRVASATDAASGQGAAAQSSRGQAGSVAVDQNGIRAGSGLTLAYSPDDGAAPAGMLTPDAVDYVAQQYIATGQLPPLGMGKVATINRDQIINRASEIERETGSTGQDAVARHMAIKSASSALTQITRLQTQVQSAERTVERNMGIVQNLAPKGAGPTGSPILNSPIQSLRKNVWGSPQVAAYDAALGTVADEYAKVMTSTTGSGGQTSDAARAEAYRRLSSAQTIAQTQQVMAAMKAEMANRTASLNEQKSALTETIRNGGVAPGAPASAAPQLPRPASKADFDRLPSGTVYLAPDGQQRRKP